MEMQTMDDENYKFLLVEFISRGPKKQKSIDIVPKEWVFLDNDKNKIVARFMPPPYTNDTIKMLNELVKNEEPASEDWPLYHVKIRGRASKSFIYIIIHLKFFINYFKID